MHDILVIDIQVDGMDILAVREATKYAADYARSGKVYSLYRSVNCDNI